MSHPAAFMALALFLFSTMLIVPADAAAKQSKVLAACKRTAGCWTASCGKGCVSGCSPHACFFCDKKVCHKVGQRWYEPDPVEDALERGRLLGGS